MPLILNMSCYEDSVVKSLDGDSSQVSPQANEQGNKHLPKYPSPGSKKFNWNCDPEYGPAHVHLT